MKMANPQRKQGINIMMSISHNPSLDALPRLGAVVGKLQLGEYPQQKRPTRLNV